MTNSRPSGTPMYPDVNNVDCRHSPTGTHDVQGIEQAKGQDEIWACVHCFEPWAKLDAKMRRNRR